MITQKPVWIVHYPKSNRNTIAISKSEIIYTDNNGMKVSQSNRYGFTILLLGYKFAIYIQSKPVIVFEYTLAG